MHQHSIPSRQSIVEEQVATNVCNQPEKYAEMSGAELEAIIALCSMMSVDDDSAPPAPKKKCVEAGTPPKEKGNSKETIVPKSSTCQAASSILPTKNIIDIKEKYANQEPSTSCSGNQ
ncbi:unnamed protein product [Caenorhabditis nigoni]